MSAGKILLVEDEIDILELIKIQLQSQGYQVIAVKDGNDAIETIQVENFDLFIIDRMLPSISGIEVCSAPFKKQLAYGAEFKSRYIRKGSCLFSTIVMVPAHIPFCGICFWHPGNMKKHAMKRNFPAFIN